MPAKKTTKKVCQEVGSQGCGRRRPRRDNPSQGFAWRRRPPPGGRSHVRGARWRSPPARSPQWSGSSRRSRGRGSRPRGCTPSARSPSSCRAGPARCSSSSRRSPTGPGSTPPPGARRSPGRRTPSRPCSAARSRGRAWTPSAAPGRPGGVAPLRARASPVELVAELTGRHGNLFLVEGADRASAGRNLRSAGTSCPRALPAAGPAARAGPDGSSSPGPAAGRERAPRFSPAAGRRRSPSPRPSRTPTHGSSGSGRSPRAAEPARAAPRGAGPVGAGPGEARRRVRAGAGGRGGPARRRPAQAEPPPGAARAAGGDGHRVDRGGPARGALALDPALAPRDNMERYYRRYRRIAESAARVAARAAEVRAWPRSERSSPSSRPPRSRRCRAWRGRRAGSAPARGRRPPRRRGDEPRPPYRSFRSLAGLPILVGRGAAQNDALTLRVARGNDLWLHARGLAGAHVVVRLEKGRAPDQETLLDAAHLAVHFSDARGAAAGGRRLHPREVRPEAEGGCAGGRHLQPGARGPAPGASRRGSSGSSEEEGPERAPALR